MPDLAVTLLLLVGTAAVCLVVGALSGRSFLPPRIVLPPAPSSGYWESRRRSFAYAEDGPLLRLARQHAGDALTMLDVGAFVPNIAMKFTWIPTKVATDLQLDRMRGVWNQTRGVAFVRGNFLKLSFGVTPFDLVICSQVLGPGSLLVGRASCHALP